MKIIAKNDGFIYKDSSKKVVINIENGDHIVFDELKFDYKFFEGTTEQAEAFGLIFKQPLSILSTINT